VGKLAETVQEATGESVELAYVDQGYTGERPATQAQTHGMRLEVVKHEEAKRGFVLLPRRLCRGARFRMGIAISAASEGL
jgi:PP-loop superfamily ATP-utilizing enzyme